MSDDVVRGDGIVRRLGERIAADLGVPLKEQMSNAVHVVADLEHANLLKVVMERYGQAEEAQSAILRGARESLAIERVFRGHLADVVASYA